jgi:hypothetical protein
LTAYAGTFIHIRAARRCTADDTFFDLLERLAARGTRHAAELAARATLTVFDVDEHRVSPTEYLHPTRRSAPCRTRLRAQGFSA